MMMTMPNLPLTHQLEPAWVKDLLLVSDWHQPSQTRPPQSALG